MFQLEEGLSQHKSEPLLAQSFQHIELPPVPTPTLTSKQFDELLQAQASHQIASQFQQQYTKPQLIEVYTTAYKFHKREADKYKGLLTKLSGRLVPDLDEPDVTLTYDVTEEMKRLLLKKNYEL